MIFGFSHDAFWVEMRNKGEVSTFPKVNINKDRVDKMTNSMWILNPKKRGVLGINSIAGIKAPETGVGQNQTK